MALFSGPCGPAARRPGGSVYHLYYCMTPLPSRLRAHVARRRLLAAPGTAVVAVSGGPDSVALLDLLHTVAPDLGLSLVVAHADHGIQADSGTVGQAVAALALRYGLPFELGELRLGSEASETAARRARYAWLAEVQRHHAARYLVTAHHRDDQVETIVLRLLRGSGPAGLAGMPARARGGLVRPLLPFPRRDLVDYVAERGLPVHDDPANRDPRHLRSWIRTVLLPLVSERLGAGALEDVARAGRAAALERRAWDRVLGHLPDLDLRVHEHGFDIARGVVGGYDNALGVAVLRAAARRAGLVLGPRRARPPGGAAGGGVPGRLPGLDRGVEGRGLVLGGGGGGGYDNALGVAVLRAAARRAGLVLGPRRARQLARLARRPSGRRQPLGG